MKKDLLRNDLLRKRLVGGLLVLVVLGAGCNCRKTETREPEKTKPASVAPMPNVETAPAPSEADSVVQTMETTPVSLVLQNMIKAYQTAHTYRDHGEIRITWMQNGEKWDRQVPYRTNLERPNRVQIQVNDTMIHADGTDFWAYTPQMPGMIIHRKCVPEIHLEDLLCDREIYLNLTNVESKRFSFLPAPLVLLLGARPLDTFLYGVEKQNLTMLAEKSVDDMVCYRISSRRGEEETIFWIDKETFVLRRVELPTQILRQEKTSSGSKIDGITMTLEFSGAEINGEAGSVTTTVTMPSNVQKVVNYTPPQAEWLGKKAPDFTLTGLDGKKITLAELQGKTVVLLFWTTYGDSMKFVFEQMEKLIQPFRNDAEIVFLAANVDPSNVTNETIQTVMERFHTTLSPVRDLDGVALRKFHSGGIFSLFLLDKTGTVQAFETDYTPNMSDINMARIREMIQGKPVYAEVLRQMDKSRQDYRESIRRWIENGIFLDQAEITQVSVPEEKIAPSTEPAAFQKHVLWSSKELKAPGAIRTLPGSNATNDRVIVLENGNTVAELGADGQVLTRHPLGVEAEDFQIALMTGLRPNGERYFVTYGKIVHLYDAQWKPLAAYPHQTAKERADMVADVVVDDLDGDGEIELYISFWSGEGVHKVSTSGELLEKNMSADVVFQLDTTSNPLVPTEGQMPKRDEKDETKKHPSMLLCIDQSGMISILDGNLRTWGTLRVKDHTLGWLTTDDLAGDGHEKIAAVSIAVGSKYTAMGLDDTGKVLWSVPLSDGIYSRPMDKIFPVRLKLPRDNQGQWLLLGADSSMHLVEMDGILIDQFNFGKIITGIASAVLRNKPVLLISTPDEVQALELILNK